MEKIEEFDALITDNQSLADVISQFSSAKFLAVDTEFLRQTTYYPILCLIQISDGNLAVAIDPLSPDIDMRPLWELLSKPHITKVFHAGRQDLEIFVHLTDSLPTPLYDTQIAAMACGLGDQVGYDKLVQHYKSIEIDKSSRFTDWSKRPLSTRQLEYALADVTHLADIYPQMVAHLSETNRNHWLDDELAILLDIQIYKPNPDDMWQKIKIRNGRPDLLNRLKYLASWREVEVQKRDMPRGRLLRDETLLDLAASNPTSLAAIDKIRGFPGGASGKLAQHVLDVLKLAEAAPRDSWPEQNLHHKSKKPPQSVIELLRVLMKEVCEAQKIAPKLLASAEELEAIALSNKADVKAMKGWRYEVFGKLALQLKAGGLALAIKKDKLQLITLDSSTT